MSKKIHITLDPASVERAIHELNDYKEWINRKAQELARRLAEYGLKRIEYGYATALYDGDRDVSVTVEQRGSNTFAIVASGETVLFLEFGAGVTFGYGHPQASQFGYGPTTYPGQRHAADPNGWYMPGGQHTFGNPPSMTMYLAAKDIEAQVVNVAREVFSS